MPRRKLPEHDRDFENMNDAEILAQVVSDFDKAKAFHTEFHTLISEWYRVYRARVLSGSDSAGRSNLFIPHVFANIETFKCKIVNAMFAERPFVSTKILDVGDADIAEISSKKMNNFLQYQFEQKIPMIPTVTKVILETLIAGVAVTKQNWNYKTKTVKKRESQMIDGKKLKNSISTVSKEIVTHDHPNMTLVSYDSFFPDPTATNINDALYVIEKEMVDYAELLSGGVYDKDKVRKLKSEKDQMGQSEINNQLEASGVSTSSSDTKKGIELLHYWTDYWHVVVANRGRVMLSEPNPYFHGEKPYSKWEIYPIDNLWWGISSVDMLYHLQLELNTNRNQRVDNVAFILNKMHKVRRGANITESDLISRSGGVITVDEMDDIEEMKFEDVTSSSYNEEGIIKKDMDTVIGVHDINRGSTGERRETATMASITDQNSNERFTTAIKMIEFGGFKDAIAQIIQLNQQFITEDTKFLVTGTSGSYQDEVMTEEEVVAEYQLVGLGKSIGYVSNRDVKQSQMSHLLNAISPFAEYINVPEFLTKLFGIFELSDVDKLVNTTPPAPPTPQPAPVDQGGQPVNPMQPAQPMGQPMPQQDPQMGQPAQGDEQMKQVIGQVVKVLQQETGGKVNPELLVRLVVDVMQGKSPSDPQLAPVVQRIQELLSEFGGGM